MRVQRYRCCLFKTVAKSRRALKKEVKEPEPGLMCRSPWTPAICSCLPVFTPSTRQRRQDRPKSASTASVDSMSPVSPCSASVGLIDTAGMPRDDRFAAAFAAMNPDFPTPRVTTLPLMVANRLAAISIFLRVSTSIARSASFAYRSTLLWAGVVLFCAMILCRHVIIDGVKLLAHSINVMGGSPGDTCFAHGAPTYCI